MACRLDGAKPLSKSMLEYCQLDPQEQPFNEISIGIQAFSFKKIHFKMSSAKWRLFCLSLSVLYLAILNDIHDGDSPCGRRLSAL